jgi:hypothetical protein
MANRVEQTWWVVAADGSRGRRPSERFANLKSGRHGYDHHRSNNMRADPRLLGLLRTELAGPLVPVRQAPTTRFARHA